MLFRVPVGAGLVTLIGFIQLGLSIAVSITYETNSVLWRIGNAIQPLSPFLQLMRIPVLLGVEAPPAQVAYAAKSTLVNLFADGVGNLLCILGYANVA